MSDTARQDILDMVARDVLSAETCAEALLGRGRGLLREHPAADSAMERVQAMAATHATALRGYLAGRGGASISDSPGPHPFPQRDEEAVGRQLSASSILLAVAAHLARAAFGYGELFALALRLFEPPLRKVCPGHLKDCAGAAREIGALLPTVVAWELTRSGLECHCICPMCGIGACGCVAVSAEALRSAWVPDAGGAQEPGFALQTPRPGSELARAGVKSGERLLEVDGVPVASIGEIQTAIRKHSLGQELSLRIGQQGGRSREIRVRHVSDFPAV
jgi:hypothetical protein